MRHALFRRQGTADARQATALSLTSDKSEAKRVQASAIKKIMWQKLILRIAAQRRSSKKLACDLLANPKIRLDSVKRMTQIQNTSQSIAATKYFTVAAREHTLAPPGRHRPRHSRMRLTGCQSTPAIDSAFFRPIGTLYQLQFSFHSHSTEPEPPARARRAGEEFY